MIKRLKLTNVGPAPEMELEFGDRLNILTGDNGLGKSFLLDIVWWALTRTWPAQVNPKLTGGKIALPTDKRKEARIEFSSAIKFSSADEAILMRPESTFNSRGQYWNPPKGRPANPGFVFYAMSDGSFAVWDPARNFWRANKNNEEVKRPPAYVFSPKEMWNGLQNDDGVLCNGLIRDWAGWQKENGASFATLTKVLQALSPSKEEELKPGKLTRISLDDVRDMPTIQMPYGQDVPIVHASSAMRRIVALAYCLVWCREEHNRAKQLLGETPENRAVFLIDEIEAHLHPKWQRLIIPAIMQAVSVFGGYEGKQVSGRMMQTIAVTHSPLVMASIEPLFDNRTDQWFDLDLDETMVILTNRPYQRQGDIRSWLTSEAFDMKSGYSVEAENVLEKAASALKKENLTQKEFEIIDNALKNVLSETDPFWMRWRYVSTKKGWRS
jgi:predicted ATPase